MGTVVAQSGSAPSPRRSYRCVHGLRRYVRGTARRGTVAGAHHRHQREASPRARCRLVRADLPVLAAQRPEGESQGRTPHAPPAEIREVVYQVWPAERSAHSTGWSRRRSRLEDEAGRARPPALVPVRTPLPYLSVCSAVTAA